MDTSQRTYRFLPADVYIAGYRVVGKIMISTNGIMGVLNDTTKSHLEVQDARLARIHMPTKLVDHFEVVRLMKNQIFAVCAARREDLGPTAVVRGGYSNQVSMPTRLTTSVYEIEGKLEVVGRFDFVTLVSDKTRNFIPLYDAALSAILIPNLKVESPAILFNREKVDMLALLSQRAKEEKPPTAPGTTN
ncbi:MAG: hypothetical protein ABI904_02775 [Chloroflexota bacterium]